MKVTCRCAVDVDSQEVWPTQLPDMPRAGDLIQSSKEWKWEEVLQKAPNNKNDVIQTGKDSLQLIILRITWKPDTKDKDIWIPELLLDVPVVLFPSKYSFWQWYNKIRGRKVEE